jgi:hypothetical protein
MFPKLIWAPADYISKTIISNHRVAILTKTIGHFGSRRGCPRLEGPTAE